mgnify:CR=1 FL=1
MALFTRDIIEKINQPLELSFEIISEKSLNSKTLKAQMLGIVEYKDDNFLIVKTQESLIVCSCETIELDNSTIFGTEKTGIIAIIGLFEETSFTAIDFTNTSTKNVNYMINMFSRCKAKKINISSFDTSNVKSIDYMFIGCQAEEIDCSNIKISKEKITKLIFENCKAFENNKVILSDEMKQIREITFTTKLKCIRLFFDDWDFYIAFEDKEAVEYIIKSVNEFVGYYFNDDENIISTSGLFNSHLEELINPKFLLENILINGRPVTDYKELIEDYEIIRKTKFEIANAKSFYTASFDGYINTNEFDN